MSAKQSTYKLSRSVKIETKETHLEDAGVERRRGWRMGTALGCRFRQRRAGGRGGAWQRWAGGRGSDGLEDGAARGSAGLEEGASDRRSGEDL
jgi:hypothetical protein